MLAVTARTLLRVLPVSAATRLSIFLAEAAFRAPIKDRDRAALARGRHFGWGPGRQFSAWQWGEAGPRVVLIHGWGGRATQMAPLAEYMATLGYCCIAPDMRAHGASPGRRIRFLDFINDLPQLLAELEQPIHALIGHSAGAMTMMRARQVHGIQAKHYVSINGPRAPYPPIEQLDLRLKPGARVLSRCKPYFGAQFGDSFDALNDGRIYAYAGQGQLLAIHDQNDDQVDPGDAEVVTRTWPSGARHRTQGLGHQRMLYDPGVHERVAEFLKLQPGSLSETASSDLQETTYS